MAVELENNVKETLSKAALEQSSSFINGAIGVTPYEAVGTVGMMAGTIEGGLDALAEAPVIAMKLSTQLATNVSLYAAEKLQKAMTEILIPPTPADILGEAMGEVSKYRKTVGEMIANLNKDSEKTNAEEEEKQQEEAIEEKAKKQKENAVSLKERVQNIVADVQEQCANISYFITSGEPWVEKQVENIEKKAKERIDKVIDASVEKILEEKEDFIEGMAEGLAKATADKLNKKEEKLTKEKLEKINRNRQKIANIAKSKVAKALLNLMASMGL